MYRQLPIYVSALGGIFMLFIIACQQSPAEPNFEKDKEVFEKIFLEALERGQSYSFLRELCKDIGGRLSGSANATKAVDWGKAKMGKMGLDNVFLQEVMVPNWKRGEKEYASVSAGDKDYALDICALGGSVSTPSNGLKASVVEVKDFESLAKLGKEQVEGKIVFYNRSMKAQFIQTFRAYGGAVNQRSQGAVEAAKLGGVASLVRSMTQIVDDNPHTGAMRYDESVHKIPSVAISTEDANFLSDLIAENPNAEVEINISSRTNPDTLSHNVIGEIKGSEFPDKIILIGGHLDSWDLGEGAHDDGAGVVHTLEALRLLKTLGIKPKHTIRGVLFMNEENGLRGGRKYAEIAEEKGETYLAAIESDRGGFTPKGFSIQAPDEVVNKLRGWSTLFEPYGGALMIKGGGGADIGPLKDRSKALIGFMPDSQRYFDYHHASTDVLENVNQRELELGAAMITALVYLLDSYGLE